MELSLIVPVEAGAKMQNDDEEINGRMWRVTRIRDPEKIRDHRFHCISYVWGPGVAEKGSFFDCKIPISDKTRQALEAAIKASEFVQAESKGEKTEAFWIDAICIPQLDQGPRQSTLESMGFIYSAAVSVIVVLQDSIWKIIETAASGRSPEAFPFHDLQALEQDRWISRVWTYQELVNGADTWFTTTNPNPDRPVVEAQRFLNCLGFSLSKWKRESAQGEMGTLENLPHLSILEEALADIRLSGYLERTALGVLSNITLRDFDAKFPQNRLLACLGALTKEASWGPPSTTLPELAEKFMKVCESKSDYSFIYTSDERSDDPGMRWRPKSSQSILKGPANLIPVINWHSSSPTFGAIGTTQNGRWDSNGFWLENMVRLRPSISVNENISQLLERYLYGFKDPKTPDRIQTGVFGRKDGQDLNWRRDFSKFLSKIGFTGCHEPLICEAGLFYSQIDIRDHSDVEMFAASSIAWKFGNPGLARWTEDGVFRYCAGVYTGLLEQEQAESVLMI